MHLPLVSAAAFTSAALSVPVERRDACSFGAYQCSGNVLQQCGYVGSSLGWVTIQACGAGTHCQTSSFIGCMSGTAQSPSSLSVSPINPSTSTARQSVPIVTSSTQASTAGRTKTTGPASRVSSTPSSTLPQSTSPTPLVPSVLTAQSASSFLVFSTKLGSGIEGAAVSCDGRFAAVNANSAVYLDTGANLVIGGSLLASSRFIGKNTFLIGDAASHLVYSANVSAGAVAVGSKEAPALFPVNEAMLQPNDFALDSTFTRMYLSGMKYESPTKAGANGELWFFNMETKALVQFPPGQLAAAGIHRTNGIELSPDGLMLYVTNAINDANGVSEAHLFKFNVDAATGMLSNPVMLVDLYAQLKAMGINPAGMDPDGMKCDMNGVIHVTLNGGQRVFRYNPATKASQIIFLPNVASPSNLQFGGKDGKRLVIIGHGCGGVFDNSCADFIDLDSPGRDFIALLNSGKC